ncbi:MAG: hypothetical protein II625_05360 [Bacilli bacterium]|nr:hypothetical protein [Bacilli bacterium]
MAKVNLNNSEFEEIQKKIDSAKNTVTEAMDVCWSEGFANAKAQLCGDGALLRSCYDDAESSYHTVKGISGIVIGCGTAAVCAGSAAIAVGGCTASAVLASCGWLAALWPVGTIIAGIIALACLAIGIVNIVKANQEPEWKYEARNILEQLILACYTGDDVNWYALANLETKLENVKLSLQAILLKVADFNAQYANLSESANEVGLGDKLALADDGVTVTNINTSVTIDGKEVETTVAEAMNAFYTYTATVTAAEIEAEYMHQKYPDLDIDFSQIVRNANGFMTSTLSSGLYSREFVDHILPEYSASLDDAKQGAITGAHGLGLEGLETLLGFNQGLLGDLGLYAGLIGTTFLPIDPWPEDMRGGGDPDTGANDTDPGTPPPTTQETTPPTSHTPGCSSPGCSSPGCSSPGCGGGIPTNPQPETVPETIPETSPDTTPGNEVEIEPVDESEIPEEELPFDYGMGDEVDYDKLAREAYEFGDTAEEIAKHQQELLDEIEKAYEDGNLDGLREKLKEYGFSGPEIEAILADKYQCIKTMMYCDKREQLAKLAQDLAKADGIEDYDTKFDDAIDYDKELTGNEPNELLMLASEDETCLKAYDTMKEAQDAYKKALDEANPIIKEANDKKKAMEEIKAKYEKEFSSEDTTKWTEEAAKEYNEAIKSYNETAKSAAAQIATVEAAKVTYQEARTSFETAENNYYEQIRQDQNLPVNTDDGGSGGSNDPTQQQDGGNNGGNEGGDNNTSGDSQEQTELHTDNVLFDENGDIIFDMNQTGEVQGATYETGEGDSVLDTGDLEGLI